MRIEVKATPQELVEKSTTIIHKLEELFQGIAPETAELLHKALPSKEVTLRYPMLHDLHKQTSVLYMEHIDRMLGDIDKVIDRSLPKEK